MRLQCMFGVVTGHSYLASNPNTSACFILCCANMTDYNMNKMLVVVKIKKVHYLKGINVDTPLVVYRTNKNAWMTSILFEEWVTKWDSVGLKHMC